MAMTNEESQEFGEVKAEVRHIADVLDEIAPMVRATHARLEKQAGFVTGVVVAVSGVWALLLAAWAYIFPRSCT